MSKEKERVEAYISEVKWYTLAGLLEGPKHGYQLMKELEETRGVRSAVGNTYTLLQRLASSGLIAREDKDYQPTNTGINRRINYQLTEEGKRVLLNDTQRILRIAQVAQELGLDNRDIT